MRMAVGLMDGTALMVIGVSSVIPRQRLVQQICMDLNYAVKNEVGHASDPSDLQNLHAAKHLPFFQANLTFFVVTV